MAVMCAGRRGLDARFRAGSSTEGAHPFASPGGARRRFVLRPIAHVDRIVTAARLVLRQRPALVLRQGPASRPRRSHVRRAPRGVAGFRRHPPRLPRKARPLCHRSHGRRPFGIRQRHRHSLPDLPDAVHGPHPVRAALGLLALLFRGRRPGLDAGHVGRGTLLPLWPPAARGRRFRGRPGEHRPRRHSVDPQGLRQSGRGAALPLDRRSPPGDDDRGDRACGRRPFARERDPLASRASSDPHRHGVGGGRAPPQPLPSRDRAGEIGPRHGRGLRRALRPVLHGDRDAPLRPPSRHRAAFDRDRHQDYRASAHRLSPRREALRHRSRLGRGRDLVRGLPLRHQRLPLRL